MPKPITLEMLTPKNACEEQYELFKETFYKFV